MKATEKLFEVIDEVQEVTREKETVPGSLLVLTDAAFVVLRGADAARAAQAIEAGEWADRIPYEEVQDIKFPSLKKIKEYGGKRHLFRIRTTRGVNYQIALSKNSFFRIRALLERNLTMMTDETVARDAGERARLTLDWLQRNPGSLVLFEELVLKRELLSVNEFFGLAPPLQQKLQAHFSPDVVDKMMSFIAFDELLVDEQRVLVISREDKEMLLESFPLLRKEFESAHFDKFGDRHAEEAEFWNNFFREQRTDRSLLWGGVGETNPRKAQNSLPAVAGQTLDALPVAKELDVYDNIEDVSNNETAQRYLSVGNAETTALVRSINNLSLSILSGTIDASAAPRDSGPVTAPSLMEIEAPVREVPSARRAAPCDPRLAAQFASFVRGSQAGFKRQAENSSLAQFFGSGPRDRNEEIIRRIASQAETALELEASAKLAKDIYGDEFKARYCPLHEKTTYVLRVFYSLLSIHPTPENAKKVKEVIGVLGEVWADMQQLNASTRKSMNEEAFALHVKPLQFLSNLINRAIAKARECGYE